MCCGQRQARPVRTLKAGVRRMVGGSFHTTSVNPSSGRGYGWKQKEMQYVLNLCSCSLSCLLSAFAALNETGSALLNLVMFNV